MIRAIALAIFSTLLAACSATVPEAPSAAEASETVVQTKKNTLETQSGEAEDVDMRVVADSPNKAEMICRREKPIGSRIGQRVCRPKGAVSATREGDIEVFERVQNLSDEERKVGGN